MEKEEMLEQTNETENVETQTTEENVDGIELTDTTESAKPVEEEKEEVKTFTQEEVDAIVQKRLARKEKDYQRELSKYKSTEEVLKKGLNATDISDAETKLRSFWKDEGIDLPDPVKPGLTDSEIKILAKAEADDIIDSGDAEVEANKLASKGYENMNSREREIFNTLAEHLTKEKKIQELKSIGVKSDLLDSKDFKEFASKFNQKTSIKDVYELYKQTHKEAKAIKKIGDLTSPTPDTAKTNYTDDEINRLTSEQLDDDKVWEAVRRSMTSKVS